KRLCIPQHLSPNLCWGRGRRLLRRVPGRHGGALSPNLCWGRGRRPTSSAKVGRRVRGSNADPKSATQPSTSHGVGTRCAYYFDFPHPATAALTGASGGDRLSDDRNCCPPEITQTPSCLLRTLPPATASVPSLRTVRTRSVTVSRSRNCCGRR